ncbi:type II toxin-antitoxin system HicB family antitoxin [Georgenia sp. MJ206]|uniref:type II toxin-antitoxin system HicB family antitoxin n=1 Tax=Georgenia wangjunii TaxID=3117730 RepID=UPI002F25FD24
MALAHVVYHNEDGAWWAQSPTVPNFTAAASTLDELRELTREGIAFYLEDDEVELLEERADGSPVYVFNVRSAMRWNSAARSAGMTSRPNANTSSHILASA